MLNQVIIVGRLFETPIKDGENVKIILSVPRQFKNEKEEVEVDNIECVLWAGIAKNAEEFLNKGDLIGVKGRLQNNNGKVEVIAEKITFLSSKKEEDE